MSFRLNVNALVGDGKANTEASWQRWCKSHGCAGPRWLSSTCEQGLQPPFLALLSIILRCPRGAGTETLAAHQRGLQKQLWASSRAGLLRWFQTCLRLLHPGGGGPGQPGEPAHLQTGASCWIDALENLQLDPEGVRSCCDEKIAGDRGVKAQLQPGGNSSTREFGAWFFSPSRS